MRGQATSNQLSEGQQSNTHSSQATDNRERERTQTTDPCRHSATRSNGTEAQQRDKRNHGERKESSRQEAKDSSNTHANTDPTSRRHTHTHTLSSTAASQKKAWQDSSNTKSEQKRKTAQAQQPRLTNRRSLSESTAEVRPAGQKGQQQPTSKEDTPNNTGTPTTQPLLINNQSFS